MAQTYAQVKALFFDRQKVIDAVDRKTRGALSRAGAFIRTRARSSMRRRKKISPAGTAPSAHEGSLKNKLFFAYDARSKSVVVGPVPFRKGKVPRVLEEGGKSEIVSRGQTKIVEIAARPYMGPALKAEQPNLPSRWSGSLG